MDNQISRQTEGKSLPAGRQAPKRVFFAAFVMLFFCAVSVADSIGFVPCYIDGSTPCGAPVNVALTDLPQLGAFSAETTSSLTAGGPLVVGGLVVREVEPVEPERIKIAAIDLDLPIQNPATRDTEALDALLQRGPARYVDSAKLGEKGTMILFAHSSHLPIVHNKMFQAFNKVPDLHDGDTISIIGGGSEYLYAVTSVRRADTSDTVSLSTEGSKLTLVTCDTLTGKSARYIVEADLIGTTQS